MLLIERIMASLANFLACSVMDLDSRDVERARDAYLGRIEPPSRGREDGRQTVVRFGR